MEDFIALGLTVSVTYFAANILARILWKEVYND